MKVGYYGMFALPLGIIERLCIVFVSPVALVFFLWHPSGFLYILSCYMMIKRVLLP